MNISTRFLLYDWSNKIVGCFKSCNKALRFAKKCHTMLRLNRDNTKLLSKCTGKTMYYVRKVKNYD